MISYDTLRSGLQAQLAGLPADAPVRLGKKTSNLFRTRAATSAPRLDVSGFDGVLSIDPVARTADVLGMTTYEHLVDATLPYGLIPLVVPQLKTITLGGAVTGLGIESTSFRNGLPHESVLEMDVLTGDGRIVTATPDNEHSELFYGFPNSYGTLGYALRLRIELEPVTPFVRLRHLHFADPVECVATLGEIASTGRYDGEQVDFVDGSVFQRDDLYLTVASYVDSAPYVSDYTGQSIYYRSIEQRSEDYLTIRDYLWRWDTDWFWCSRAFGAQNPRIRRLWPKRWLRSDVYWKIVALENRIQVKARLDRRKGLPERESVIQDVEVPLDRTAEFVEWFCREVPIRPFWLCPLRQRDPDAVWDLYVLDPDTTYVNVGFWSTVPLAPGDADGTYNRKIERVVDDLGGRKSLYSTSFYEEDEFWRLYGGDAYERLKKTYDPDARLLDLYAKCVQRR